VRDLQGGRSGLFPFSEYCCQYTEQSRDMQQGQIYVILRWLQQEESKSAVEKADEFVQAIEDYLNSIR